MLEVRHIVARKCSNMPSSYHRAVSLPTVRNPPFVITEAWSGGETESSSPFQNDQPTHVITDITHGLIQWCTQSLVYCIWHYIQHILIETAAIVVEKVPPSTIHSLPSLQHMHLIAESIEDLKTQQQILHALLDDLRRSSRCCCGSGGRCSKTTRCVDL